jgi:hypothetical protein
MTVNPLPPQAYTRETLQKAYTWLLTQSASVKEMASSQDMLISLYLKAQRNGDASLDTPSIQNFKQELKSLANLIGDLQTPQASAQAPSAHSSYTTTLPTYPSTNSTPPPQARMPQNFAPSAPPVNSPASGLDEQSLAAIQDIKATLNLSSDVEALRALISLGYKQFRKM